MSTDIDYIIAITVFIVGIDVAIYFQKLSKLIKLMNSSFYPVLL